MNLQVLDWLLEEKDPGVRKRTLTGLCGLPEEHPQVQAARRQVLETLPAAVDLSWMELKGLARIYNLTALAECGLTRQDVPIDPLVERLLAAPFDAGCGDMMALRALVMLGYSDDPRFQERLAHIQETQLQDGGWLCLHRLRKMERVPKSCIKSAMHALLLAGELAQRGQSLPGRDELVHYFLARRLFYRMDDPTRLVLDCRPGWRMTNVFFPIEVQRVGLPLLMDALAALGVGRVAELEEAWNLLDTKKDTQGKIVLEGTLDHPYLPKEKIYKPSKWATLYACLAWRRLEELEWLVYV